MSTTRVVCISPDGRFNAYRGKVQQASIRAPEGDMTKEYLEYYRLYPLRTLDEIDKENSDGPSAA